jgi:hypothetical protein
MRNISEFLLHFSAQVGIFLLFCFVTVLLVGIAAGFLFRDAVKAATKDEERPKARPHEPAEPGVPA